MTERELDVLARTIYGEARGETHLGKISVAWTIINRTVKGGWWGGTIIGVCLKPKQFSCWNDKDPNRPKMMAASLDDADYRDCYEAALMAFTGRKADPTDGATHYHTHNVSPPWAQDKPYVSIGGHRFYKDIA